MKNLLGELGEAQTEAKESEKKEAKKAGKGKEDGDIEMGNVKSKYKNSKYMAEFFQEVESVQEGIKFVKEQTDAITALSDRAKKTIGKEKEEENSNDLQKIIKSCNEKCKVTKAILSKMKNDTNKLKEEEKTSSKISKGELGIRRNLHQTLTQKFVQVVRENQRQQQQYKETILNKVTRQVRVVKPEATMEEIDTALRSGDPNAIYRAAILNSAQDPISEAYANAADKYQDVLRLETSIVELHQMFVDLALIVDQQGEMLDKIEFSVNAADEYVIKGNDELDKALAARKALRKKYFILGLIIAVILVVILGGVLGGG